MKEVRVELPGQDLLIARQGSDGQWSLQARGCAAVVAELKKLASLGKALSEWPLPEGRGHAQLLISELLLKVRGQWNSPYTDDEICHCRAVPTRVVEQAILNGAHTPAQVSRETTASTSCTTCRPDVEKLIGYWLHLGPSSSK